MAAVISTIDSRHTYCITVAVNAFDGCHTMIVFVESIRNYIGETMAKGVIIWILLI